MNRPSHFLSDLVLRYHLAKETAVETVKSILNNKEKAATGLIVSTLTFGTPAMVHGVDMVPKQNDANHLVIQSGNRMYKLIQDADPTVPDKEIGKLVNNLYEIQKKLQPDKKTWLEQWGLDTKMVFYDPDDVPTVVDSADGIVFDEISPGQVIKYDRTSLEQAGFNPTQVVYFLNLGEQDGWFYSLTLDDLAAQVDQNCADITDNREAIAQNQKNIARHERNIQKNTATNKRQDSEIKSVDYRVHQLEDERDGGKVTATLGAGYQNRNIPVQLGVGYEFKNGVSIGLRGSYQDNGEEVAVDSSGVSNQYGSNVTVNSTTNNAHQARLLAEVGLPVGPFRLGIGGGASRTQDNTTRTTVQETRDEYGNLKTTKFHPAVANINTNVNPVGALYLGAELSKNFEAGAGVDVQDGQKPTYTGRFTIKF